MTYDEVVSALTELCQEPDTALARLGDVLKDIKADYDSIITLSDKLEKGDKRIRDLQDTNMRLFLAQTGQTETAQDEEDDLVGADATDAFVKRLLEKEE